MVKLITTTESLKNFCKEALISPYITIDTEFLRERTYYAKLCLIQMAFVGDGENDIAIIDVQSTNIDLGPLYEILNNKKILKVFHAARQDLEIFFLNNGFFPRPFFDTQVAAMVCGFGDQVGYETLVKKLTMTNIDKSSRFTNWSQRPLSEKQLQYASADVSHLRKVYEELQNMLNKNGRSKWLAEELNSLLDEGTYENCPTKAWHKIKTKNSNPHFLTYIKSLAAFRERLAQSKNLPRNRILKDEMILELAAIKPITISDLRKSRLLSNESKRGALAEGILSAVKSPLSLSKTEIDKINRMERKKIISSGLSELLRVLLKAKAEQWGVAQKLIASSADLDSLASETNPDIPALTGWRLDVFGKDALRLKAGEIALSAKKSGITIIELKNKETGIPLNEGT